MKFLPESDPRRKAWEACESPIEEILCCGLFAMLGCRAVAGRYKPVRDAELAAIAGDAPAAFVFAQHWIANRYRADFLLVLVDPAGPVERFVFECDGHKHHATAWQIRADAERTAFIEAAGYPVVRFAGADIHDDMNGVLRRISKGLISFGIEPRRGPDCGVYLGWDTLMRFNAREIREARQRWRDEIDRFEADFDAEQEAARRYGVVNLGNMPPLPPEPPPDYDL